VLQSLRLYEYVRLIIIYFNIISKHGHQTGRRDGTKLGDNSDILYCYEHRDTGVLEVGINSTVFGVIFSLSKLNSTQYIAQESRV